MDPLGELARLYESFRRIPIYVAVIMVFAVFQFIAVTILGSLVAMSMRRIADAAETMRNVQPAAPASGNPYLHPFGGQPPQYGPRP